MAGQKIKNDTPSSLKCNAIMTFFLEGNKINQFKLSILIFFTSKLIYSKYKLT